jgi:hypothetical protein
MKLSLVCRQCFAAPRSALAVSYSQPAVCIPSEHLSIYVGYLLLDSGAAYSAYLQRQFLLEPVSLQLAISAGLDT